MLKVIAASEEVDINEGTYHISYVTEMRNSSGPATLLFGMAVISEKKKASLPLLSYCALLSTS